MGIKSKSFTFHTAMNTMKKQQNIKSYNGYEEGMYASRKGRLCRIKKIHFTSNPPFVTVLMMDNDTEVGTEFDRIKPVKAWYCNMCTAENDNDSNQCHFCKFRRTYKEKIAIQEEDQAESDVDGFLDSSDEH